MNFLLLYLSTVCVSYYLLFWIQNYIVLLFMFHMLNAGYAGWWMMIVRLLKPMLKIKMMLIDDPIPLSEVMMHWPLHVYTCALLCSAATILGWLLVGSMRIIKNVNLALRRVDQRAFVSIRVGSHSHSFIKYYFYRTLGYVWSHLQHLAPVQIIEYDIQVMIFPYSTLHHTISKNGLSALISSNNSWMKHEWE